MLIQKRNKSKSTPNHHPPPHSPLDPHISRPATHNAFIVSNTSSQAMYITRKPPTAVLGPVERSTKYKQNRPRRQQTRGYAAYRTTEIVLKHVL